MEIFIHGPFSSHEFIKEVEPVLKEARWKKEIEDSYVVDLYSNRKYMYAERIASHIRQFIEYSKIILFSNINIHGKGGGQALNDKVWVQTYIGNIGEKNYEEEANKIIDEVKKEAERKLAENKLRPLQQIQEKENRLVQREQTVPKETFMEQKGMVLEFIYIHL